MRSLICPNINTPEWKALEAAVGKFEAYRDFIEQDGEIRNPEIVQAKLGGSEGDFGTGINPYMYDEGIPQVRRRDIVKLIQETETPNTETGLNYNNPEFHINTLNAVGKFLEAAGIEQRLVPSFMDQYGNPIESALAVANFIKGTVDIIDDIDKRPAAWNKLPEEAAHFWYRLLKKDSDLKQKLWEAAASSERFKNLMRTEYAGVYDDVQSHIMDSLTEETVGQLIADAIKRVEENQGAPADYSFLKAFMDWLKQFVAKFKQIKTDPFEVAAMKILSGDTAELMSFNDWKFINDQVYFSNVLTEDSLKQQNALDEVFTPYDFLTKLFNGKYRQRTRFLSKTISKLYNISSSEGYMRGMESFRPRIEGKLNITTKLTPEEVQIRKNTIGYTQLTPSLKGLPLILDKFKKNPISLNSPIKVDGVKKEELSVYNAVADLIKKENPALKSISAEDFVNEVHNYLEMNYALGFADEKSHLGYRIAQTFKHIAEAPMPATHVGELTARTDYTDAEVMAMTPIERRELARTLGLIDANPYVQHRKISIRFNDMEHNQYGQGASHFQTEKKTLPSAWGNLTAFYSSQEAADTGKKDAVLIHEIQNDNIEALRSKMEGTSMNLDAELNSYFANLDDQFRNNIDNINSGSKHVSKGDIGGVFNKNYADETDRLMLYGIERKAASGDVLTDLREKWDETINLYEGSDNGKAAYEAEQNAKQHLDKGYLNKMQLRDFINRGGIKSVLSQDELNNIKSKFEELNADLTVDFNDKKRQAKEFLSYYNRIIAEKLFEMYGENNIFFDLNAFGKSQTRRQRAAGGVPTLLETNTNQFTALNEKRMLKFGTESIVSRQLDVNYYRGKAFGYKMAKKFMTLTPAQFAILYKNMELNVKLLKETVDIQSKKELALVKDPDSSVTQAKIKEQNEKYEHLKQEALEKKEKLGIQYETTKEEVAKTIETELGYFTPLVHHLIQTHIKEYGKNTPLYFSGYAITKLTQGSESTANIYKGPEEVAKYGGKVGSLWTAFNAIPGVKLQYQKDIPGFKTKEDVYHDGGENPYEPTGGYKVDLSNYHYESPLLYGLDDSKAPLRPVKIKNDLLSQFKREVGLSKSQVPDTAEARVASKMKAVNAKLGTSYYVKFTRVGQSSMMTYEIINMAPGGKQTSMFYRETSPDLDSEKPGELENLDPSLVREPITLDVNEINKTRAVEIATKLADRLASQLGVSYEIITAEEAQKITKDATTPWNGEAAFYIGNTVYFIGDKLTTDIVLHEFGHPLVRAISHENPELFNNLYKKVLSTSEGSGILADVKSAYPELPVNSDLFKEEVIVRALALTARNHIGTVAESTGFIGAIKDILYAIKKMLRRIFGKAVKVENLDVNTSLDELGNMLASENFQISKDKVTDADVIAYMREQNEEIEALKKLEDVDLQRLTDTLSRGTSKYLNQLEKNKDYAGMLNVLKDKFGANELKEIQSNLSKFHSTLTKSLDELKKDFNFVNEHVSNMASSLHRLDHVAEVMIAELEKISKETPTPELIGRVNYYNDMITFYKDFAQDGMNSLIEGGITEDNRLYKHLNTVRAKLTKAEGITRRVYKTGTRDIQLHTMQSVIANAEKDFQDLLTSLEKRGAPAQVIADHKARYEAIKLTPAKMEKILNGELGDMNAFHAFFGGFASSKDPIIASFGLYVKKHMMDVETIAQAKQNRFLKDVYPLIQEAGIGLDNVNELSNLISFVDKTRGKNEDGDYIMKEVRTFLNGFKDYRYELGKMEDEIYQAQLEAQKSKDYTEVTKLKADYAKHLRDYFHQDNIPDFYDSDHIFKTELGIEAKAERDGALFKIKDLNSRISDQWDELEMAPQLDQAWKEYRQLFSVMDLNGNRKTGRELEKVQLLKLYREVTQGFYEMKPIAGRFENALDNFEQIMVDTQKIPKGSLLYNQKRDEWIKRNTRTVIKPEFYTERKKIFDEVTAIMARLPKDVQAEIDITKAYEDINEAIYGFRDQDGQPDGASMSAGRIELVKKSQELINAAREKFAGLSGLTAAEMEELNDIIKMGKENRTQDDRERMAELFAKKDSLGIDLVSKARLTRLWAELAELQHKEATDYYVDIFNNYLSKVDTDNFFADNGSRIITKDSADFALNDGTIADLMEKSPEFKTWFEKNHIKKKFFNMETKQKETRWERLYIWNVVRPNNDVYLEKTPIRDATGKVVEEIVGVPTFKYFSPEIKPEFKTKRVVGKTVDNLGTSGNFLPKTVAQGAPDARYINQAYFDLQTNNPKAFAVLEKMKEHHLENQSSFDPESRLYMDVPRYETTDLELAQRTGFVKKNTNAITEWWEKVKNYFRHSANDQEEGMNYDSQFNLIQGDLYNNAQTKIPITGLSDYDIDQVSQDIPHSMMRYMLSGERQKKLIEMNPVAIALKNVLATEGIKHMAKESKFKQLTRAVVPFRKKKGQSIRSAAVDAYYEREFHGEHNTGFTQNMKGADAVVKMMSKSAAFGMFALNIPSALKNSFSAMVQNMIESSAGKHLNPITYHQGIAWSGLASMDISMELYKHQPKGLRVQLIELFDPASGRFQEQVGQGLSRTMFKDAVSFSWMYSPRKWTELNATLGLFGGMMIHKKINMLDGTEISYMDAWEIKDGQAQLKPGIDPKYGQGGEFFKDFRSQIQEVSNNLNGAFSKFDAPLVDRYLAYRMIAFMRRYFPSMAANRFGAERLNAARGEVTRGYYLDAMTAFGRTIKTGGKYLQWMSPNEKRAFLRLFTEVGTIALLSMAMSMLFGWDPDDKERYAKLRAKSGTPSFLPGVEEDPEHPFQLSGFLSNHTLNLLMNIKAESTQWVPVPGLGLKDYQQSLDWSSVMFGPTISTYAKLLDDIASAGSESGYYKKAVGPYEWEQADSWKFWNHLAHTVGVTGGSVDPVTALQNYQSMRARK
jgi:hypothetical protein